MREIGENARAWKGENAGYVAKHSWIVKHYGKANKCEICKSTVARRFEWANISGLYKRDVSDYRMLCASCHRKEDHGNMCRKGHEYTKENTYMRKEGWRCCKTCMSQASKKHKQKKNEQRDKI